MVILESQYPKHSRLCAKLIQTKLYIHYADFHYTQNMLFLTVNFYQAANSMCAPDLFLSNTFKNTIFNLNLMILTMWNRVATFKRFST